MYWAVLALATAATVTPLTVTVLPLTVRFAPSGTRLTACTGVTMPYSVSLTSKDTVK